MNDRRLELRRSRNLGEIISDAFGFLTPNWKTFAAVVGPAVMVQILLQLLILLIVPEQTIDEGEEIDLGPLLLLTGVFLASLPVIWVIYQLTTAGVVVVLTAFGEGRTISAGDALDAAQDRARDLLLASLRSTLIILLLTISVIGIPWAVKRFVQWSLIVQGIMIDGVGHGQALGHSAALVEGSWWYTLGRLVVAGLVIGLPGSLISGILSGMFPGVVGVILGGCVGFFTLPYPIIATTLIFFHQKAIKAPGVTNPEA